MAEELYFIKTNPTIAKINLFNKLCREEKGIINFLEEDKKTSLGIIKTKVQDSINTFTQDEFLSIYYWLKSTCPHDSKDQEEIKTQLFINGIDLLFEIPSKSNTRSFQHLISDYDRHTGHHLSFVSESKDFNQFLIYAIFYTGKLHLFLNENSQQEDTANEPVVMQLNILKFTYKDLYELAELEFNTRLLEFENFIEESEKIRNFHQSVKDSESYSVPSEMVPLLEQEKDLSTTADLYHTLSSLYELTKYGKDPIIRLHSC